MQIIQFCRKTISLFFLAYCLWNFQEIYTKLKAFAASEDHLGSALTIVAFIGSGHGDGQTCLFQTRPTSKYSKPFEIWANCKNLFKNKKSTLNRNRKPKLVFIQLIEGKIIIRQNIFFKRLKYICQNIYCLYTITIKLKTKFFDKLPCRNGHLIIRHQKLN